MTTVNIHIDQLILDGIDLPDNRREQLKAAVEAELSGLIIAENLDRLRSRDGISSLSGGKIVLSPKGAQEPNHLGKQIAGAVKEGVDA